MAIARCTDSHNVDYAYKIQPKEDQLAFEYKKESFVTASRYTRWLVLALDVMPVRSGIHLSAAGERAHLRPLGKRFCFSVMTIFPASYYSPFVVNDKFTRGTDDFHRLILSEQRCVVLASPLWMSAT